MSASMIGTFQFRYINGSFPGASLVTTEFSRPGYAGWGVQVDAVRGQTKSVEGMVAFTSANARSTALAALYQLPDAGIIYAYTNDSQLRGPLRVKEISDYREEDVASDTLGQNFHLYATIIIQSMSTS